MEKIYCSSKKHDKVEVIFFCQAYKVYICKCLNHRSRLFEEHKTNNLIKDSKQIFTGICNEKKA